MRAYSPSEIENLNIRNFRWTGSGRPPSAAPPASSAGSSTESRPAVRVRSSCC